MDTDRFCPTCGGIAGSSHTDAASPASVWGPQVPPVRLTKRETAVYEMIMQGLTNDQIAQRMFVTRNTVKFHLKQVYRKLGIRHSRRKRAPDFAVVTRQTAADDSRM